MRRLKILIWHVHGSYLDAITSLEHDWYLPVVPGEDGYGGRRWSSPAWVHEVPAASVQDLDLDLVIFQTPKNYREDQFNILSSQQQRLPRIYLEHNVPRPHAVEQRHPVDDPRVLVVHVTHFNRLMWDHDGPTTMVIEHSVAIDRTIRYDGAMARGITVINGMPRRNRIVGLDIFLQARERVPLDAAGIDSESFGGLGDIPYRDLHRRIALYRFLFSPIRYTSLPLAVVEAMTIGMPVVALATTEVPTVITNGENGYISCNVDELIDRMRFLLSAPDEARRMGDNARATADLRFGLERFKRDWNMAFERASNLS
ncbi:MAG: glycosyltransferase family 4 protein [Chloroflexota bacterium]